METGKINTIEKTLLFLFPAISTYLSEDRIVPEISGWAELTVAPLLSFLSLKLSQKFTEKEFEPPYQSSGTRAVAEAGNGCLSGLSTILIPVAGTLAGIAARSVVPLLISLSSP